LAEWWIEDGIGETRCALVEDGGIVEARILIDGIMAAGSVLAARLVSIGSGGRNAVARDASGSEYLLPRTPAGVTEGAALTIAITREAIPGAEPWKRPIARATDQPAAPAPAFEANHLPFPPSSADVLAGAGWNDLCEEAESAIVDFPGGSLRISPTPAMTLIDVDGMLPPVELAIAGSAAAAKAIRRLGIGGSIGIDLPTVAGKAARQAASAAIDAHLPQPFERTAMNGFGFVQIVRPRLRASLLEIFGDRSPAAARALLRRAALAGPGARRLAAHPAVTAVLDAHPEWLQGLARQIGGAVSLRADPACPIFGGHAEQV
jgi:ribonuclease G